MIRHPHYSDVSANPIQIVDVARMQRDASCVELPYEIFYFPDDEIPLGRVPWTDRRNGSGFGTDEVYEFLTGFCAGCPVVEDCFTHAVFYEEHGFWAGTSPPERKQLRAQHGIALRKMYDSDVRDAEILQQRAHFEQWGQDIDE